MTSANPILKVAVCHITSCRCSVLEWFRGDHSWTPTAEYGGTNPVTKYRFCKRCWATQEVN
jgi:hypothetical protein